MNTKLKNWFMNTINANNQNVTTDAKEFYLKTISPEFTFAANGEVCDFQTWYQRYERFKKNMRSIEVKFEDIIAEDNKVSASYWVNCIKKNGSEVEIKILGIFTVSDNKFIACDELYWIRKGSLDLTIE